MKRKASPATGDLLPYAEILVDVSRCQFTDVTFEHLAVTLRGSTSLGIRFSIIRELILRIKGLSLFDTQLSTACSLLNNKVAELPTGEGKTLAAVVAAVCYVLDGRHVHILVFNDYLAKRDCEENRKIYEVCGVTVGFVDQHSTREQRKRAYSCDVTYVSAKQAGFDYLRDFTAQTLEEATFPPFDVAIVDEADSIMIDKCTTPLVLAGEMPYEQDVSEGVDECVRSLESHDYEVFTTEHQVWLTEDGIDRIEQYFGLDIYREENHAILSGVQNALEARHLLSKDKDYIVGVVLSKVFVQLI